MVLELAVKKDVSGSQTPDWQNLLDAIGLRELAVRGSRAFAPAIASLLENRPLDENRRVEQVRQLKSAGF